MISNMMMANRPTNNENKDSFEASPDDDLNEMASSNFGVLPCCNSYYGPKNDKESQKMFGNVKRIFQLWRTVKNKKINVSEDSPKIKYKPDKPTDIDVFLNTDILEDNSNLEQPLAASSSCHVNQSHEKSIDHKCLNNTHCSKQDCSIPEMFQSCIGTIHTQIDYVHWLVPDLLQITNCNYYWGVMDRFEAEKVLENRAEGTFLLRDSAQEEFLFSVSFRRYSRSLHARVEQLDHKFSFDSHDSSVFASRSVCGLIEHYKDPSCCMFFEPMLTIPLPRIKPFKLQQFCRATICTMITYDGISCLPIPKTLKQYLQYYHYKQKVRVRQF